MREYMSGAIQKFGNHLRYLPDVNTVIVDEGIDYIPVDLPCLTVEEYKINRADRFLGQNSMLYLTWLVTIYAPTKEQCRLIAARIRYMYRKINADSYARFQEMNTNYRIAGIDFMNGELAKYSLVNNDPKCFKCTMMMEVMYDEIEDGGV